MAFRLVAQQLVEYVYGLRKLDHVRLFFRRLIDQGADFVYTPAVVVDEWTTEHGGILHRVGVYLWTANVRFHDLQVKIRDVHRR